MQRANRVSVQSNEQGGYTAKFHRTHKLVGIVESQNTLFVPPVGMNKTAEREAFRMWVCENAGVFDLEWDPADRRAETNTMPAKYTSDKLLVSSAGMLVGPDVDEWVGKVQEAFPTLGIELVSLEASEADIVPTTEYKGRTVSHKYGNGNWAYAEVPVVATVKVVNGEESTEGYVTLTCQLVSGQLKKPSHIADLGYTLTGFKSELVKDIPAFAIATKVAEDAKVAQKEAEKLAKKAESATKTTTPEAKPETVEGDTPDTQEAPAPVKA